jgi:hypothetical protein
VRPNSGVGAGFTAALRFEINARLSDGAVAGAEAGAVDAKLANVSWNFLAWF